MRNSKSFNTKLNESIWTQTEKELGFQKGGIFNIGWYCSDRICQIGKADKIALLYEDFSGLEKKYTFSDLRITSNTIGAFLTNIGLSAKDRVCLVMDKVPELYFSIIGILKIGSVVQPLFAAFGDESLFIRLNDAGTRAIITQSKYLPKIRRIRDRLPSLEFIVIVDHNKGTSLKKGEFAFSLEGSLPIEELDISPTTIESPSVLHYTSGTTGQPKGVQHVHHSLISQYFTTNGH